MRYIIDIMKTKTEGTAVVAIRESVYKRMVDYRAKRELPPSIVGIVTQAVERWLDAQESSK